MIHPSFMPTTEFCILRPVQSAQARLEWCPEVEFEQLSCAVFPEEHQRPGRRLGTLQIRPPEGRLPDFAWTYFSECVIREEVLSFLKAEGLTGGGVAAVAGCGGFALPRSLGLWFELELNGWGAWPLRLRGSGSSRSVIPAVM